MDGRYKTQSTDDKRTLWHLRKVPLLDCVPPAKLAELVPLVELREISRRQVIYLPGDPGQQLYFINGGRVKCSRVTRDGKELILGYRNAGQIFGELAVIDGAPQDEMTEAMKNAIITSIPCTVFRSLMEEIPELARRFLRIVGERRRRLENKLEHLVFLDVQAKLSSLLLELGEEYGMETENGVEIGLKITHQEIANLIGSTRETISLTLAHFKKKSWVDIDGRSIVILDHEGLRTAN